VHTGLGTVSNAYREAQDAIASTQVTDENRAQFYADAMLDHIVASSPFKSVLYEEVVEPLEQYDRDHRSDLLATLQAYCAAPVARGRPARQRARCADSVAPKQQRRHTILPQAAQKAGVCAAGDRHRQTRQLPGAHREILASVEHRRSKYLNNRAENSHQPTRQRERAMKRFTSPGHAQRFLPAFSGISPYFRPGRHRITALKWRTEMADRFAVWQEVTATDAAA
jgi:hypothetical protein